MFQLQAGLVHLNEDPRIINDHSQTIPSVDLILDPKNWKVQEQLERGFFRMGVVVMQKLFPKNQILTFFLILTEKKVIMKSTAYNGLMLSFLYANFQKDCLKTYFQMIFQK